MFRVALVALALCACSSLPAAAQEAASSIRGRVFAGNSGQPIRGARVSVSGLELGGVRQATTDAEGRFEVAQLRAVAHADTPRPHLVTVPVVVSGENIDGVTLTGSEGGAIDGRVEMESSAPFSLPVMRLSAGIPFDDQPDAGRESVLRSFGWSDVTEEGAFAIKGVFGRTRLRVALPPDWAVTRGP